MHKCRLPFVFARPQGTGWKCSDCQRRWIVSESRQWIEDYDTVDDLGWELE